MSNITTRFKKGNIPWNKGKPMLIETRLKIANNKERAEKISNTFKSKGYKPIPYQRNKNVILTCNYCKKEYIVNNARKNISKYCSMKCMRIARKGADKKTIRDMHRTLLTNKHISKQLVRRHGGVNSFDIPDELIELKRAHIELHRTLRTIPKESGGI